MWKIIILLLLVPSAAAFSAIHVPTQHKLNIYPSSASFPCRERSFKLNMNSGRALPDHILGAYASWDASNLDENEENIIAAVKSGVNVIFWFSVDLSTDEGGAACIVSRGPPKDFFCRITVKLREELSANVAHMITIGGWNAKHPTSRNTAEEIYSAWKYWNEVTMAEPSCDVSGFDGIDWDIEGNDDKQSTYNHFTVDVLETIGRVSQLAKKDGYLVSMAPMESYLDPSTSEFSRSCNFTNPEWAPFYPDFTYHGRNVYAYLLVKFGKTQLEQHEENKSTYIDTFDFVMLQLYESYGHMNFAINQAGQLPSSALRTLVRSLHNGWMVRFSSDPLLCQPDAVVRVHPNRLVIGLANAWAAPSPSSLTGVDRSPQKVLFLRGTDIAQGWRELQIEGLVPRGFGFWSLVHEGDTLPLAQGGEERVFLGAELAKVLK